jgi:hypothetical protein
MKPALDLAALAQTWSDWLNGDDVSPEEQDGDVVFKHLKLADSGLLQPRIHEHRFKKPATIQEGIVNLLRLIPSSGKRVCYPGPPGLLGGPLRTCDLGPTLESMAHFVTVRGR